MNYFKQNSCRFCRKVFCCENCRSMHEQSVHNIHPKCGICIDGQTTLKNPSPDLIEHVKNKHWPLHCVHCSLVFDTIEEIFVHNKCPASRKKKAETPENQNDIHKYKTPPLFGQIIIKQGLNKQCIMYENQICITTSTPVHRDEKDFVQIISEVITPVDNVENKEIVCFKKDSCSKSALTPILCDSKKNEQHSKRKVTFSEHIQECFDENSNENILTTPSRYESGLEKDLVTNDSEFEFYTAHEEIIDTDEKMEETENDKNEEVVKQSQNKQEEFETTVWKSTVTQMDVSQDANVEMVIASPNPIIPAISYVCTVRGDPRPNETSPVSKLSTITYFISPGHEVPGSDTSSAISEDFSEKSEGIWSSMANIFKNVIQGLSGSNSSYTEHSKLLENAERLYVSQKRPKPDIDDDPGHSPAIKKMKFTEIKCRRPIRNIRPFLQLGYSRRRVTYAHKLTQTD